MKTAKLIVFCLLILFVWEVEESHSALVDRGGGLVYDNVLNVTWLQDASLSGPQNWAGAVQWAQDLTFNDPIRNVTYSDWRLPTTTNLFSSIGWDLSGQSSEMAYMFYINLGYSPIYGDPHLYPDPSASSFFPNFVFRSYWSGTDADTEVPRAWYFHFHTGLQDIDNQTENQSRAWAVRDGDVAAVPIPGAAWLLGSGLLGFIALKRKL